MDGGGGVVLRSTVRAKNGFAAAQRGSSSYHYTVNDENIVLCANEYPNFVNRECVCCCSDTSYIDEKQRHSNVNVRLTLTFDNETLAALHDATASSYQVANETANITAVNNKRYVYAVSNLRYDEWNTN
eukprot:scaffold82766_cov24-Cyclotella_meneghiniana.AAC.1